MCGIVALVRLSERPLPRAPTVRAMVARLKHRGPDGEGFFFDDDCALGAARLAIVDPAGGHPPLKGCGPITAVANCELYNHEALRATLHRHALVDRCDATLLPHLYEEHGARLVEHLRGMFAFALWDGANRRLLLARDRLGLKPLFYASTPDVFLAASEPKALFEVFERKIDRTAVDDLFTLGYPCPPRTMFEGVRELPPGHTLVVEAGRAVQAPSRYWRAPIPPRGEHRKGSFVELAGELREVLREAAVGHARADVPVAAALSGGLDSSMVVALSGVKDTFSLTFPDDPAFDESRYVGDARRVAMTAAVAARLPEMIAHLEVPMLMPGALGGLLLADAQRAAGFKVCLTGDGADELLGGYDVFRAAKARRLFGERAVRLVAGSVIRAAPASWGVDPPWFPQTLLLGGRTEPPEGWSRLLRDDLKALDPLDAQIAVELETRLPSWILVISDRSFMARGVEARVPFLDDRVVPFVLSLPPAMKLRLLREKAILREAARGLLPPAIIRRRKQPFMTPLTPWFFQSTPEPLRDPRLFDPAVVAGSLQALPRAKGWERVGLELRLMLMLGTELLARQETDFPVITSTRSSRSA